MNLRVLEDDRIVMELPDGAEHVVRNSELIPAYYCLPKEFLEFLKSMASGCLENQVNCSFSQKT